MPTVNNNITIEDNNTTISIKNASTESLAIIEDFEADFGFSLDELPNLDLGLAEYCNQLPKDEEAVLAFLIDIVVLLSSIVILLFTVGILPPVVYWFFHSVLLCYILRI